VLLYRQNRSGQQAFACLQVRQLLTQLLVVRFDLFEPSLQELRSSASRTAGQAYASKNAARRREWSNIGISDEFGANLE
jgi:hypothetical protein